MTRLTSPGWPENYPDNLVCEWTVRTAPGSRVKMKINSLLLESSFYGCPYDKYEPTLYVIDSQTKFVPPQADGV